MIFSLGWNHGISTISSSASGVAVQPVVQIGKPLLCVSFEICGVRILSGLFVFERRGSWAGDPKETMLHEVNMMQPLVESLILQRRRMRLKGPPMLRVGPFLVSVEFVQIGMHKSLPARVYKRSHGRLKPSTARILWTKPSV
jgi:hypothetical protein